MSYVTMSWEEFLKDSEEFLQISNKLGDSWTLVKQSESEGGSYLRLNQKLDSIQSKNELLNVEYHIIYSISYQVPVLYFQVFKSDGALLKLEEVWAEFDDTLGSCIANDSESGQTASRAILLETLTQMEHPLLFRPYLALHPCRTPYLLNQCGPSKNSILTFISLMGPYVKINLNNKYGDGFK